MSVDSRELQAYMENLSRAEREMPGTIKKLINGEGVYAVKQAKRICTDEDIVDEGHFRNGFHKSRAPIFTGNKARINIHNDMDYASHVEYGHIVVTKGEAPIEERRRQALERGVYVRGRYVLTRAIERTESTQTERIKRKLTRILEKYFGGGA